MGGNSSGLGALKGDICFKAITTSCLVNSPQKFYSSLINEFATSYRIVAIDARCRREGRALRKVGFYDPLKNQTYLNVPAILYFLERGAQPTGTVHYNGLMNQEIHYGGS
ncbi:hypothetical protein CMV_027869 [Castanea mollissima]|uniref:30S ribosomal protein S16, chloroplastic n=1 Tax=Castanea mollissima TaxID=60419 RepID=A0A8J4V8Y5_9ROSI|nr:hypothetical protein CMV_027869 [Castanea mollissima]